jgi:hypothetical protein
MSEYFDQLSLPNGTHQNLRLVKRNNPLVSLCIKAVFFSAAAFACTSIAAASPSGGVDSWGGGANTFASGTTITMHGTTDGWTGDVDDRLIQLAFHNNGGHTNNGGAVGNTGPGNQGNDKPVGKACCDGGFPGGGGGGGGGGGFLGSNGGSGINPWLLIRGSASVADGGTQPPGALGLVPGQITCSLGENGVAIASDGQVLFAQFFAERAALEFGKNGCGEVVNYPNTEETGG